MRVVAGEPDHRWNQLGEARPPLDGGVIVDQTCDGCQQWVGARRMIAPSLTGKVGRQLHKTGALTGVAVLSSREHRKHVGQIWLRFRHGRSPGIVKLLGTSVRRYGPGRRMP